MSIERKEEYSSIRQEMLERFERIHDTTKYGLIVFFTFLTYYYSQSFDDMFALFVLQALVATIGLSILRLYRKIYELGTYIELIIERNLELGWHKMSRSLERYRKWKSENDPKWKGKEKWWDGLPYPIGLKWGGDSASTSLQLLFLSLIAYLTVYLKSKSVDLNVFIILYYTNPLFVANSILVLLNSVVFLQLWYGMKKFRESMEETWKYYRDDFGKGFKDPTK